MLAGGWGADIRAKIIFSMAGCRLIISKREIVGQHYLEILNN